MLALTAATHGSKDRCHSRKKKTSPWEAHLYVSYVQQLLLFREACSVHMNKPQAPRRSTGPPQNATVGTARPLTLLLPLDEEDQKIHANVNYREKGKRGEQAPPPRSARSARSTGRKSCKTTSACSICSILPRRLYFYGWCAAGL